MSSLSMNRHSFFAPKDWKLGFNILGAFLDIKEKLAIVINASPEQLLRADSILKRIAIQCCVDKNPQQPSAGLDKKNLPKSAI